MATQIKLRRDTYQNWYDANPVLAEGEPGYDLTNKKLKIGDGTTLWRVLPYFDDQITDLSSYAGNIIPSVDSTYNLGSPTRRWNDAFLANNSVYIGDIKLSNNSGTLVVQQVTNAGLQTEASVESPGVVTTKSLANGSHRLVLTADGTVTLNGQPFGGGVSISDFGEGFSLTDTDKIVTNKLYSTNATQPTQHYRLELDTNGVIILPDQSVINGSYMRAIHGSYAGLAAGPDLEHNEESWMWVDSTGAYIATKYSTDQHEWKFNNDGSLTFPTLTTLDWDRRNLVSPTLQMGNDPSVNEVVITGPTPDQANPNAVRLIIQGQEGFGSNNAGGFEGGDVYIWAGHGGEGSEYSGGGGDVKLRGGPGGTEGGYIRLEAGNANAPNGTGGFLDLNAGNGNGNNGNGGNVNIRAGNGVGDGYNGRVLITGTTEISTGGGTWNFDNNGSLRSPNGYTLNRGQQQYINAGDPPTVVYTSQDGYIGAIKAMIKVVTSQASDPNGDYDADTQVCEMIVTAKRRYTNNGNTVTTTPVASVYGVTHTSTLPLATFTVNYIENLEVGPGIFRDVVQILAEATAAVTGQNIWVIVAATEMTND